ncbi:MULTISPECIES: EAL and HDOD domain-containing protein [Methylomonas]|uniref:EAL and HDOD domain-containing protein n=1 Tax=Methylomonas TaxID=416 RepID=UPI001231ED13|nr:HDOD domain-containing protein [Methylomonas rhizoryzae]
MTDFLIGRQQILDKNLNTYAYEILFRGNDFDLSQKDGATSATNQVITDLLLEIGLKDLVGPHLAFINFTEQNILDKTPLKLPKNRIVIEVLENVVIDSALISNLRELSQQGYVIALDDFELTQEWLPILEFCNIVKIDVLANGLNKSHELIEKLKPYKLKLLAEKIETHEEFNLLRNWGCELFQGFFFSKPHIVEGKRLSVSQTSAIQLLNAINRPNVGFDEISKIITIDAGLTYKLLHYINSASFALPNKIKSIQQALTILGLKEIKRWVNILTLSAMSAKPTSVLQNILIRAKMCELLALELNQEPETFFLVGLLSGLDSILDMSLEKVLEQLPISEPITQAILVKSGHAGAALDYALAYERWNDVEPRFHSIPPQRIAAIYLEAVQWWANQIYPLLH